MPGGLGTHCTLDLAGRCKFGPDVEWIDEVDYGVQVRQARAVGVRGWHAWSGTTPSTMGTTTRVLGVVPRALRVVPGV